MNGGTIIIRDYKDRANAEPGELLLNFEVGDTYGFVYWCDNDGNIVPIDTTSRHDLIDYIRINLQVSPTEPTEKDLSTTWYDSRPNADAVWDDLLNTGTMATIKFYDGTKFNTILPRTIAEAILFDHPSYGKITLREYVDLFEELLDFKGGKVPSHIELMANFRTSMTLYKADGTHRNPSGYADGKYFTNGLVDYGNTRFAKNNMLGVNLGTASINGHSATLYYEGGFISRDRTFLFDVTVKQNAHVIEASDTFIVEIDLDGHTGSTVNVVGGVSFNAAGVVTGSHAFNRDTGAIYKIVVHGATHDTTSGHLQLGGKTTSNNCETLRSFVSTTMGGLTQQTLANLVLSQYTLPQLPQIGQVPNTITSYDDTNHIPGVWMKDTDLGDKTWVTGTITEYVKNNIHSDYKKTNQNSRYVKVVSMLANSHESICTFLFTGGGMNDVTSRGQIPYIISLTCRNNTDSFNGYVLPLINKRESNPIEVFGIMNGGNIDIYVLMVATWQTGFSVTQLASNTHAHFVADLVPTNVDPGYPGVRTIQEAYIGSDMVGLGNVQNYGISDSITLDSSSSYASSKAVKHANDNANTKLPLSGGTMTGTLNMGSGLHVNVSNGSVHKWYMGVNSIGTLDLCYWGTGATQKFLSVYPDGRVESTAYGQLYGTLHKPSAADVGALPITGGTMTGAINGNLYTLGTSTDYPIQVSIDSGIRFKTNSDGLIWSMREQNSTASLRFSTSQSGATRVDNIVFDRTGNILVNHGNVRAVGYDNSWGVTSGEQTGAFNAYMGNGTDATWILSGTSNGVFRGGIQLYDPGTAMRLYVSPTNYYHFSNSSIVAPTLANITTNTGINFNHTPKVNNDTLTTVTAATNIANDRITDRVMLQHYATSTNISFCKIGSLPSVIGSGASSMAFLLPGGANYGSTVAGPSLNYVTLTTRGNSTGSEVLRGTVSILHAESDRVGIANQFDVFSVLNGSKLEVWIRLGPYQHDGNLIKLSSANAVWETSLIVTTTDPGYHENDSVTRSYITKGTVGLGNVQNYGVSSSVTSTSTTTYANSAAVKSANDNANTKLPLSGGTMTGTLNMGSGLHVNVSNGSVHKWYMGVNSIGTLDLCYWGTGATQKFLSVYPDGRVGSTAYGQLYGTLHKPSAADVGALPITGGTMTGDINTTHNISCKTLGKGITWASGTSLASIVMNPTYMTFSAQAGTTTCGYDWFATNSSGTRLHLGRLDSAGGSVYEGYFDLYGKQVIASGKTTSWGTTAGFDTGAFSARMGTSVNDATWLLSGSINSSHRGGIQLHNNGSVMRIYCGGGYMQVTNAGYVYATRVYNAVYNDYAELFETPQKETGMKFEPGDIVMIDVDAENEEYIICNEECSPLAIGVVSDEYAHLIGGRQPDEDSNTSLEEENERDHEPIGLAGRLRVKITGHIKKGDRVVSSSIPGVGRAYKLGDDFFACIGTSLENKTTDNVGRVRMLIGR